MVYWFFGYPGIGKDYCAKHLSRIGKFPHIDADDFLTIEDREKLLKNTFTQKDRLRKLERIVFHLEKLLLTNQHIAVADSLPDNKSREYILKAFPDNIKLILVTVAPTTHKERLQNRKNHFFTKDLLEEYIRKNWQPIKVPFIKFVNNSSNAWEENLKKLL